MKYINFKRYKFSTILKFINFKRYNFSKFFKYLDFRRYNFSKFLEYLDFRRYYFSKFLKYLDFRRYDFSKFLKYLDFRRYNFSKFLKYLNLKRYKFILAYFIGILFLIPIVYLSAPIFYSYKKSDIENIICKDVNVSCSIEGKINYSFLPTPRIKLKNLKIMDLDKKSITLGEVENVSIKLSIYNLLNKKKFNYKTIELINAQINFDFANLKKYKNTIANKSNLRPISLKKGEIIISENKNHIATISNVNLKYKPKDDVDEVVLKGIFLGDEAYFKLQNKKTGDKPLKIITIKLLDSRLFTKINIFGSPLDKKKIGGDLLFKIGKNRVKSNFDYKDNQLNFKNAHLRNAFLEGRFNSEIKFLPYFNFDIDLNLSGINFNKFHNFFIDFHKENKENFFKINKKINGVLNLSADKIYSKYNLFKAFESRIQFVNGNVLVEQLLFNLGKIGAADVVGQLQHDSKFTNFKFENNIFIDDQKRFYSKFGIYNKKNIPSSFFVSGTLDLVNLNMRFYEIFDGKDKYKQEDIVFIEKEFNDIILEDGYATFFDYIRLKEFIKIIAEEGN